MNKLFILDAGHGGIDTQGQYTTAGKLFKHTCSGQDFHGDGYFYEGVSNRIIAKKVINRLNAARIAYAKTYAEYEDISLYKRVDIANYYSNYYDCFLISVHSNSSPTHRARGVEVFTTKGNDKSDNLAQSYFDHCKDLLGSNVIFRPDRWSEPDPYKDDDKETDFYIISEIKFPGILVENLFFDQCDDAILLSNDWVQELFAEAIFRTVLDFINS